MLDSLRRRRRASSLSTFSRMRLDLSSGTGGAAEVGSLMGFSVANGCGDRGYFGNGARGQPGTSARRGVDRFRGGPYRRRGVGDRGEDALQERGRRRAGSPASATSTGITLATPPQARVALAEDAAVAAAVADGDHQLRVGRRVVGAPERDRHVLRHRAGDQQHVGVARAGDEPDAQALDVVVRVAERVDLQLAAVARARVDLPDGQRAPQDAQDAPAGGGATTTISSAGGGAGSRS